MKKYFRPFLFPLFFLLYSCSTTYRTNALEYEGYRITSSTTTDKKLTALLKPYSDSVNATMNDVIGYCDVTLEKAQPESSLGNFMTDAFLTMANEKYGTNIDAAFVNYGGIRLTQLPAGPVTTGKIYELMPFDNLLLIQKVKGNVLKQLLDFTAARGGWPMAGITMKIKNKEAADISVGGKPLDQNAEYTIANSDFVINGGDNMTLLKDIPAQNKGYLMRDAILDYVKDLKKEGENITVKKETRISYAQ